MNILILSNLFGNNRQGYDLANELREQGHRVRLVQFSDETDASVGNYGVKFVRPHGVFSKFQVLWNLMRLVGKSLFCRKDIVVCIGGFLLPICAFYKILHSSRFVYYSLEYMCYDRLRAYIIKKHVDRYIDVEEHRLKRIFEDLKIAKPSMVIYNLPGLAEYEPVRGKLRQYLRENCGATGDERILIYAGSYQKYACLENIVRASAKFPDDMLLVLMVAWGLPDALKNSLAHCKVVPPQRGMEFFDWLSDADCALLPYEDDRDFNVQNCSPQKLFDCYLLGLPFLGSNRPIIRELLEQCPGSGMLCNFLDEKAILRSVDRAVMLKNEQCSEKMKAMCREKYNYHFFADRLVRFICDENIGV